MQMYEKNSFLRQRAGKFSAKKLFASLLMICLVATAMGQTIKIDQRKTTVLRAFENIEQQAAISFAYDSDFDPSRVVTLSKQSLPLEDLLYEVLKGSGFTYRKTERHIVIQRGALPAREQVVAQAEKPVIDNPEELSSIVGYVVDSKTNAPIVGAEVKTYGAANKSAATDELGMFSIAELPLGKYDITVAYPNYSIAYHSSDLTDSNITKINISLQPEIEVSNSTDTARYTKPASMPDIYNNVVEMPWKQQKTPTLALKTNLLYDLTGSANLGVEFKIARKFTVDISGNYNGIAYSENKHYKHYMIQPELRYWIVEPFNTHFIGLHGMWSHFNASGMPLPSVLETKRYQGDLYGGGISYGYQMYLSPRLSLEFTVGAGFLQLEYDMFECQTCGKPYGRRTESYFGPTKAGISLIYIIK